MRLDPFLADHLATFGINVANEQKTEKSLTELVTMATKKNVSFF
jgi:uncharacterized UBP type Zn finger protein